MTGTVKETLGMRIMNWTLGVIRRQKHGFLENISGIFLKTCLHIEVRDKARYILWNRFSLDNRCRPPS